jgi:hypothetical protein
LEQGAPTCRRRSCERRTAVLQGKVVLQRGASGANKGVRGCYQWRPAVLQTRRHRCYMWTPALPQGCRR